MNNSPPYRVFIDLPDAFSIGYPVMQGMEKSLGSRVEFEFLIPQYGTYRQDWFFHLKEFSDDIDVAVFFGFLMSDELPKLEEMYGRIFIVSNEDKFPMWWKIGHHQEHVGKFAAAYLKTIEKVQYGFVGYRNLEWSRARYKGFREELGVAEEELFNFWREKLIYYTDEGNIILDMSGDVKWIHALAGWIKTLPPLTALLCANDMMAKDVVIAAKSAGIDIPEHLAVLGVDNLEQVCLSTTPQISSVDMQWERLGQELGELIYNKLTASSFEKWGGKIQFDGCSLQERETTGHRSEVDAMLAKAKACLIKHLEENPSRKDVAKMVGTSDRSLARYFRSHLGTSFQEEKRRFQLNKAKDLLRKKSFRIVDVAEACGFSSASSFSRWTKMHTGMTPNQLMQVSDTATKSSPSSLNAGKDSSVTDSGDG